jgi:hypothetical protein
MSAEQKKQLAKALFAELEAAKALQASEPGNSAPSSGTEDPTEVEATAPPVDQPAGNTTQSFSKTGKRGSGFSTPEPEDPNKVTDIRKPRLNQRTGSPQRSPKPSLPSNRRNTGKPTQATSPLQQVAEKVEDFANIICNNVTFLLPDIARWMQDATIGSDDVAQTFRDENDRVSHSVRGPLPSYKNTETGFNTSLLDILLGYLDAVYSRNPGTQVPEYDNLKLKDSYTIDFHELVVIGTALAQLAHSIETNSNVTLDGQIRVVDPATIIDIATWLVETYLLVTRCKGSVTVHQTWQFYYFGNGSHKVPLIALWYELLVSSAQGKRIRTLNLIKQGIVHPCDFTADTTIIAGADDIIKPDEYDQVDIDSGKLNFQLEEGRGTVRYTYTRATRMLVNAILKTVSPAYNCESLTTSKAAFIIASWTYGGNEGPITSSSDLGLRGPDQVAYSKLTALLNPENFYMPGFYRRSKPIPEQEQAYFPAARTTTGITRDSRIDAILQSANITTNRFSHPSSIVISGKSFLDSNLSSYFRIDKDCHAPITELNSLQTVEGIVTRNYKVDSIRGQKAFGASSSTRVDILSALKNRVSKHDRLTREVVRDSATQGLLQPALTYYYFGLPWSFRMDVNKWIKGVIPHGRDTETYVLSDTYDLQLPILKSNSFRKAAV